MIKPYLKAIPATSNLSFFLHVTNVIVTKGAQYPISLYKTQQIKTFVKKVHFNFSFIRAFIKVRETVV